MAIEWELHGTWPQAARLNLVALSFDASMKPVEKLRDQGTEIELSHFDLHNTDQISGWFPNCS